MKKRNIHSLKTINNFNPDKIYSFQKKDLDINIEWHRFSDWVEESKKINNLKNLFLYAKFLKTDLFDFNKDYVARCSFTYKNKKYECFNPIDFKFIEIYPEVIEDFIKNYKKGIKYFKLNYFIKYPDLDKIKYLIQIYNSNLKSHIRSINFVYNSDVGFYNGLLFAYSQFEDTHRELFDKALNEDSFTNQKTNKPSAKNNNKLSMKEIALLHHYKGEQITWYNAERIAKEHGWTSGQRLKVDYDSFLRPIDRVGFDSTSKTQGLNQIKRIEKISSLLSDEELIQAKKEIKTIESKIL